MFPRAKLTIANRSRILLTRRKQSTSTIYLNGKLLSHHGTSTIGGQSSQLSRNPNVGAFATTTSYAIFSKPSKQRVPRRHWSSSMARGCCLKARETLANP